MTRNELPNPDDNQSEGLIHGVCTVIPGINVDTDAIFPKQFLKTIKRTGLEDALFADLRFHNDGTPRSNFILNRPGFSDTQILIGGHNFGCGSSREHAVWALRDFGIRALISSQFGSIFHNNCVKNGLWPLVVSESNLIDLVHFFSAKEPRHMTLDTDTLKITSADGALIQASLPASDRAQLMSGLDEIGVTQQKANHFHRFETAYHRRFPWCKGSTSGE